MTLQRLADMVGCAKSYLWQIEHDRRVVPPGAALLERLERALLMKPGTLVRQAQWQSMPASVRERVVRLESQDRVAKELVRLLRLEGVDGAHRRGALRALVDRIDPAGAQEEVGAGGVGGGVGGESGVGTEALPRALPREVPLINKVSAGYPREFTDLGYPARVADEYVRTPEIDDPDAFAARVVGESMLPDYREGDIVVFSPSRAVRSGMDCFARLEPDAETTFKRVYFEGDPGRELIRLQPLNPAFAPRVLPRERVAGLYAAVSVTRKIGE